MKGCCKAHGHNSNWMASNTTPCLLIPLQPAAHTLLSFSFSLCSLLHLNDQHKSNFSGAYNLLSALEKEKKNILRSMYIAQSGPLFKTCEVNQLMCYVNDLKCFIY